MDRHARRIDTLRILGNTLLGVALLITAIGLASETTPAKGYFAAALLVFVGVGFRLEAALRERRTER